jgi:DNA topoisomerase I
MRLAQQLYQDGMITYMRTESSKYSDVFLSKIKSHIISKYGNTFVGNLDEISNLISKLPHEAIRVTDLKREKIDGDPKLKGLYNLIYRNTVESCMPGAKFNSFVINVSAPLQLTYSKQVDVPLFNGWLQYIGIKDEPDYSRYIECLRTKNVKYNHIKSVLSATSSHSYYSEAGLIKKLEELGIGRPSTYPSFIDINVSRGFIKNKDIDGFEFNCIDLHLQNSLIKETETIKYFCVEKNKLIIQEIGVLCIEFLKTHFSEMFDYSFTKLMEEKLDFIKMTVQIGVIFV